MERILHINEQLCDNCNLCDLSCPLVKWLGFETINDAPVDTCFNCGHCLSVCPKGAIEHYKLKHPERAGGIPGKDEMLNLICARRSVREYKNEKISANDWDAIIKSVKYTPTSHNAENIEVIIIENRDTIKKLSLELIKMVESLQKRFSNPLFSLLYKKVLGETSFSLLKRDFDMISGIKKVSDRGADPIFFNAPAIVLFIGPKTEIMSKNDSDLAAQTVTLLAPSMGMGTCYSGLLSAAFAGLFPSINKIINVPEGMAVFNALVIGYQKYRFNFVPERKDRKFTFL